MIYCVGRGTEKMRGMQSYVWGGEGGMWSYERCCGGVRGVVEEGAKI